MTVAIIFPDGVRLTADTWEDLEDKMMADEWNPSDPDEFRREMALRAMNWSRTKIDHQLISRQFFEELERAGLIYIEEGDVKK